MKKILVLMLAPAVAVMTLVGLLFLGDGGEIVPSTRVNCEVAVDPQLNQQLGHPFPNSNWEVVSYEGEDGGFNVVADQVDEVSGPDWPRVCRIKVRGVPDVMKGVDWRMGLTTPLKPGHGVKAMTVKFMIKAEDKTSLPTGSVYVHDGIDIVGQTLKEIGTDWTEYAITIPVKNNSRSLETWLRIGIGEGQVVPSKPEILVSIRIEAGDTRTEAQRLLVSNNFSIVKTGCKVLVDDQLKKLLPPDWGNADWIRYLYPNEDEAPDVTFVEGADGEGCGLKILRAPQEPKKGLDWRIGKKFSVTPALQGKKLIFSVKIKATAPVAFDSSRAYTYNGVAVKESAIDSIGPEWKVYETEISLDQNVSSGEVWYRLLLDNGTVKPSGETLFLKPSLRLAN